MKEDKVTITLTATLDGITHIEEIDGTDGVIILTAHGDDTKEVGIVDIETRVVMVAAALLNLPQNTRDGIIRYVQSECNDSHNENERKKSNLVLLHKRVEA